MTAPVLSRDERDLTALTFTINELGAGRSNAVGLVTLAASTTTTTVVPTKTSPGVLNCAVGTCVFLFPTTANAAAAAATTYVAPSNVTKSQFIVTHANAATTDRVFYFLCIG